MFLQLSPYSNQLRHACELIPIQRWGWAMSDKHFELFPECFELLQSPGLMCDFWNKTKKRESFQRARSFCAARFAAHVVAARASESSQQPGWVALSRAPALFLRK